MKNKKHVWKRILASALSMFLAVGTLEGSLMQVKAENHNHETFTAWTNTSSMPQTAGSYYLTTDVQLSQSAWSVPQGTVNLCLNGHTITQTSQSVGVISVSSGAELNLYDEENQGKITGGEASKGGGVYVRGTFTMNGGNITENTATYNHTDGSGGGVCVSEGTFTMNGGLISKNEVVDANGGGVVVRDGGTFLMAGGKITENMAGTNRGQRRCGGGVYVSANAKFTMSDGEISNNRANNSGGGVNLDGTFTMNGGTISGNIAISELKAEGGGGIANGGTFIMNGGTVSGNKAKYGGGVLYSTWSSNPMTFSGNPVIKDNIDNNDAANNLYLMAKKIITIKDELAEGADIGVSVDESQTSNVIDITGVNNGNYSKYFHSDNSSNSIKNSNNVVQVMLGNVDIAPFEGEGTVQAPYQISSKEDLEELKKLVNEGTDYANKHFILTEDIDLQGGAQKPWTAIGTEDHPFTGSFDGDGHTVKNLYVSAPTEDNQGLFGVNSGTIKNLTVEGSVSGKDNIGGIAGTNKKEGTIQNCTTDVIVDGENNVGGIVGKNEGTVTGCTNKGSVTGSGTGVGGVAGSNNGTLENDRNTASVNGKDNVGGITGTNGENGKVIGCINSGDVTGEEGAQPGAVIGNNQNPGADSVKDDYYQKTDTVNKDLTGIGKGTGAGSDPAGITSGEKELPDTESGDQVADARKAIQEALEGMTVSNDTTEDSLQTVMEKALADAGLTGVTVRIDDFAKTEATIEAAGSVSAKIIISSGMVSDELDIAKTISMLPSTGPVDEVKKKIDAIGEVTSENAGSKKDLIEEAREAYDKLTEDQKDLITPEDKKKLTDAEKNYDNVTGGHNQEQADKATEKIDAIPSPVKNDEETKKKLEEAQEAYDSLTTTQKDMVSQDSKDKLEESEQTYNKLVADDVKGKIDAIGTVTPENVLDKKELIEDAREAYDKLTEDQKELLDSSAEKKLTDAEKILGGAVGGEDQAAVDRVIEKINAIPSPMKNDKDAQKKLTDARDAYDKLTETQKAIMPETYKKKLEDAEKEYNELVSAEVKEKIDAIGTVTPENVTDKKELITDARDAYNELSKEQQELINPSELKKLTDAEKLYDDAAGGYNQAAADRAKEKIDAIPSPVKNDEDMKIKLEDARDAYDNLTETQKDMLPEASKKKLEDAEKEYNKLVTDEVKEKIDAIGEVTSENVLSKKDLIEDGRSAYDKLNESQKELIDPSEKKKLTDAEKIYDEATGGHNQEEADKVADKIDAIPEQVGNDEETKQKIEDAKDAYDSLTGAQKDMVPEDSKNKLEESEEDYNKLAAEDVKKKIEEIGEVTPENVISKKDLIEEARKAYDDLNEKQKELISPSEKKKLTGAEKIYDDVTGGYQQAEADKVKEKIDAIPVPVTAGWDTKGKIEEARKAYDALTGTQKDMVPQEVQKKLENAEKDYRSQVSGADEAAVQNVIIKINDIGIVIKTDACAQKIKDARDSYNALTGLQKNLMPPDILKKLTDAETAYAVLPDGDGTAQKPALPPEKQKQIDNIAEKLGVSKETAEKIQSIAEKLGVEPETLLLTDSSFTSSNSESDLKGSQFSRLQAKAVKTTTKKVTLKWKKIKGADGYLVYGVGCGKGKLKLLKTIKKSSQTTYNHTKVKKGKPYRYVIRAYKIVDGRKITISASKMIHIFTEGGKYGNSKTVKLKKSKVTVKKGKTLKISAKEIKKNKPLRKHRALCYESSNKKVATVTKKGVIRGKAKGTCKIYVYTQSGIYKTVKVTVK
ncbi:MAG: hypothetical protein HFI69_02920 [Lachnospiraceae bacterium]|nr:hypothetical protein [Lachnospiraceae bacterium]